MNLPIPTHLQEFLTPVGEENNEFEVTGTIHCSCSSEKFEIWTSNEQEIIKLICVDCGQEILLFDAGKHGWNGFVCKDDFLNRAAPFQKYRCPKCTGDTWGIIVSVSIQKKCS